MVPKTVPWKWKYMSDTEINPANNWIVHWLRWIKSQASVQGGEMGNFGFALLQWWQGSWISGRRLTPKNKYHIYNSSRWLDRLNLIHGMSKQPHVFARVSGWGMDHVHVSLSELFVCFANTRHHFVSWNWTIGSFKMHWSSMCSWQNQCVSGCYSIGNDTIFYWIVQKKAKVRSRHIYVNANRTSTRILTLTGMCTLCKVSLYAFTRFLGLNIHAWLLTKQNDHKSKAPTNPAARKQNQTQQNQAIKHALTSYKKITFPRPTTPTHMLSRRQQQSTKPTFWWQFHWTLRYERWVPSCISSPFRCRRPECSCEEDK